MYKIYVQLNQLNYHYLLFNIYINFFFLNYYKFEYFFHIVSIYSFNVILLFIFSFTFFFYNYWNFLDCQAFSY